MVPDSHCNFSLFVNQQTVEMTKITTIIETKNMASTVKSFIEMNTALAISAGFIGLCCLLASIARIVVSRTVKSCLAKELLYEAIAAAELCSCCFELIIGECGWHKTNRTPTNQYNVSSSELICWAFLSLLPFSLFFYARFVVNHRSSLTTCAYNAKYPWKPIDIYSCRQFWRCRLCDFFVLFDDIVVNGLGRCNGMLLYTHGKLARGKDIVTFGFT